MKLLLCALSLTVLLSTVHGIESPQLKVQPFTGVAVHIAPERQDVKLIDGLAGVSIAKWYSLRFGMGVTSYSWGVVFFRQIWIVPLGGFVGLHHVWANNERPWMIATGLLWWW